MALKPRKINIRLTPEQMDKIKQKLKAKKKKPKSKHIKISKKNLA